MWLVTAVFELPSLKGESGARARWIEEWRKRSTVPAEIATLMEQVRLGTGDNLFSRNRANEGHAFASCEFPGEMRKELVSLYKLTGISATPGRNAATDVFHGAIPRSSN